VHTDHLGRPARMMAQNGVAVWDVIYSPFGAASYIADATAKLDMRFPGQWFQLESGLAYNWHRHYDATLGRYVQPDPIGYAGGRSLYGYVGQNPISYVDRDGQNLVPVVIGAGIGAVGDLGAQLILNHGTWACVDWSQVAISAALGAIGSGWGAATIIKEPGLEFSHWIPSRYVRPLSRSGRSENEFYKPWLDVPILRDFINSALNGNYVPPIFHALTDPFRNLPGMSRAETWSPWVRLPLRTPAWLAGAGAGTVAGMGYSSLNQNCGCGAEK